MDICFCVRVHVCVCDYFSFKGSTETAHCEVRKRFIDNPKQPETLTKTKIFLSTFLNYSFRFMWIYSLWIKNRRKKRKKNFNIKNHDLNFWPKKNPFRFWFVYYCYYILIFFWRKEIIKDERRKTKDERCHKYCLLWMTEKKRIPRRQQTILGQTKELTKPDQMISGGGNFGLLIFFSLKEI